MNETDEILKALDDKTPRKKPSNWSLYAALYFAELIFVLLDAGSAVSVGYITGYWYYGLIVFLAGVVPLWLYTKTYTRALASKSQKDVSMIGGIVAVSSVILMGAFVAALNFAADYLAGDSFMWIEVSLAISLVILLAVHGMINAYYFFADEEIVETNKTERIIARGNSQVRRIGAANEVASAKRREVTARQKLEHAFSPEVVAKIMSMMADDDGDGIPNFIDPVDNRKLASTSKRAELDPKGTGQNGQEPRQ